MNPRGTFLGRYSRWFVWMPLIFFLASPICARAGANDWEKIDTSSPDELAVAIYPFDLWPVLDGPSFPLRRDSRIFLIDSREWQHKLSSSVPSGNYWSNVAYAEGLLDRMASDTTDNPIIQRWRRLEAPILFSLLKNSLVWRIADSPSDARWVKPWQELDLLRLRFARDSDSVIRRYFRSLRTAAPSEWGAAEESCHDIGVGLVERHRVRGSRQEGYNEDHSDIVKLADQISKLLATLKTDRLAERERLARGIHETLGATEAYRLITIVNDIADTQVYNAYANLCPRVFDEGFWETRFTDGSRLLASRPQSKPLWSYWPELAFLYPHVQSVRNQMAENRNSSGLKTTRGQSSIAVSGLNPHPMSTARVLESGPLDYEQSEDFIDTSRSSTGFMAGEGVNESGPHEQRPLKPTTLATSVAPGSDPIERDKSKRRWEFISALLSALVGACFLLVGSLMYRACPSCDCRNRHRAKYCGGCGTLLHEDMQFCPMPLPFSAGRLRVIGKRAGFFLIGLAFLVWAVLINALI